MTSATLAKLNLSRPISVAASLQLNVSTTKELALDNHVYEQFREWGFAPTQKNNAIYPFTEKLTQSIVKSFFFGFNEEFKKPSKEKLDASSLAIRMGFPGQLGRLALNSFVVGELKKIGLAPSQGRHGAMGANIGDCGVYPINNPVVKRIIREFFEDIQGQGFNGNVERYAIRIGA